MVMVKVRREFAQDWKFSELSNWRGPSLGGTESGALMHIPTTGWTSYLRIRVYIVLGAGSCRVQESFDRILLVLICPNCLICGLSADLCPQWKVGIIFTHLSPSYRDVVAEASRNSVLEDCGRRIKSK